MENDVFSCLLQDRLSSRVDASHHAVTVVSAFKKEFDTAWTSPSYRLSICPPKKLISALNGFLQSEGFRALSVTGLARAHKQPEVDAEMAEVLKRVESLVTGTH